MHTNDYKPPPHAMHIRRVLWYSSRSSFVSCFWRSCAKKTSLARVPGTKPALQRDSTRVMLKKRSFARSLAAPPPTFQPFPQGAPRVAGRCSGRPGRGGWRVDPGEGQQTGTVWRRGINLALGVAADSTGIVAADDAGHKLGEVLD